MNRKPESHFANSAYRLVTASLFLVGCFFTIRSLQPDVPSTMASASAEIQGSSSLGAMDAGGTRSASESTVELVTTNIEDIRLGQRVVGTNPLREQTQPASDVNPATWRAVELVMHEAGIQYDLAFLRPLSWIEATGAVEGGTIHLELDEMGLNGPAQVTAINPCPEIEADDGTGRNVVTGTMAHPGPNILYLDITGLDDPLGVTDTHPIWSETRQDFVKAGQLRVGEEFRSLTGAVSRVSEIHPHRGPPELVYNLEVDGEHVYTVCESGLLVHNAGCTPTIPAYADGSTVAPIQGGMTNTTGGIWKQLGGFLSRNPNRHVGTISRNREEAEALARQIAHENGIPNPTLRFDDTDARGFWPHFHVEDMPMNLHFWWPE